MTVLDQLLIKQPRLAAHLFRPMRLLDRQMHWIEDVIQMPLNAQDLASVQKACALSGVKLGEYYHWYLQKRLVSDTIRNLSRAEGMGLIQSVDSTDYSQAADIFSTNKGVLIALPHHAHYIFSVVAIAEKLRQSREVLLFFGEPGRNPGNEIFDHMCAVFYGPGSNVETVHDTRQGLARAMRALREGAVVFILPDAFLNEEATLAIPFCGSALNIMLGTAILARKTGALIQPVLSTPHGKGFGFKTEFAPQIVHESIAGESDIETRIRDYEVMRRVFGFYEKTMSHQIVYWQQVRRHLSQQGEFRDLSEQQLNEVANLLAEDPALTGPQMVVDLRAAA